MFLLNIQKLRAEFMNKRWWSVGVGFLDGGCVFRFTDENIIRIVGGILSCRIIWI